MDSQKKSQKNCTKSTEINPPTQNFFPIFFWWAASYMRILSKHSKHLIFFCNFVNALGYRNTQ